MPESKKIKKSVLPSIPEIIDSNSEKETPNFCSNEKSEKEQKKQKPVFKKGMLLSEYWGCNNSNAI